MTEDYQREIVLKAWDTYQGLIAGLGDARWKIRSVFYTASFGLIAASFSSDLPVLYLLNPALALLFCVLEAGFQRIQEKYIAKTLRIERTINDILTGESTPWMPDDGISTGLGAPSFRELLRVFRLKKYLFWLSYAAVTVISLTLFFLNVTKSRFIPPVPPPCATVLCCPCSVPSQ